MSGALYQTAGDDIGTMFGTPVRGRWMPADLAGPARYEVFLGVLASPLNHPVGPTRRPGSEESADAGIEACVAGRLVTVVKPIATARPDLQHLEEQLTRR